MAKISPHSEQLMEKLDVYDPQADTEIESTVDLVNMGSSKTT